MNTCSGIYKGDKFYNNVFPCFRGLCVDPFYGNLNNLHYVILSLTVFVNMVAFGFNAGARPFELQSESKSFSPQ